MICAKNVRYVCPSRMRPSWLGSGVSWPDGQLLRGHIQQGGSAEGKHRLPAGLNEHYGPINHNKPYLEWIGHIWQKIRCIFVVKLLALHSSGEQHQKNKWTKKVNTWKTTRFRSISVYFIEPHLFHNVCQLFQLPTRQVTVNPSLFQLTIFSRETIKSNFWRGLLLYFWWGPPIL